MPVIEPVIRPPSEADSFLLQVTTGCSSNHCTFCGAYQGKNFTIKESEEILEDISFWRKLYSKTRKVFLMDGDALAAPNSFLTPIFKKLNEAFPDLARISSYANGYNITRRSDEEMAELFNYKLRLIYIGLESGSQEILDQCKKKSSALEMIQAVHRATAAGIKSSVIVMLVLGGESYARDHVRQTIAALNRMQPRYLSFLCLMVIPGTVLFEQVRSQTIREFNAVELLKQARDIIEGLELEKTIFRSDHASNYLALEGRFPKDKEYFLEVISMALKGKIPLKPEFSRGL